jgi:hypothetical protein
MSSNDDTVFECPHDAVVQLTFNTPVDVPTIVRSLRLQSTSSDAHTPGNPFVDPASTDSSASDLDGVGDTPVLPCDTYYAWVQVL